MTDARTRAMQREAEGDADGAAREYAAAGAHEEAARVLTLAFRPLDAAIALFAGIDMISADLEPAHRSRAQLAASLLREGGREDHAKMVLGALGGTGPAFPSAVLKSVLAAPPAPRPSMRAPIAVTSAAPPARTSAPGTASPFLKRAEPTVPPTAPSTSTSTSPAAPTAPRTPAPPPRAAEAVRPELKPEADRHRAEGGWHAAGEGAVEETIRQFLATGRKGAAARVAWEAGQFTRALPWFVELDLKYQAGSCLRSLGRDDEALTMLLGVPLDDTRYRRACFDIVALAKSTGRLDFEIDRFLTAFVGEGPSDATECDAFLELADLYAGAGFAVGARRCAEGVLRIRSDDARAKAITMPTSTSPRRASIPAGDLTALPSVDDFATLARKHMPPRPAPRR